MQATPQITPRVSNTPPPFSDDEEEFADFVMYPVTSEHKKCEQQYDTLLSAGEQNSCVNLLDSNRKNENLCENQIEESSYSSSKNFKRMEDDENFVNNDICASATEVLEQDVPSDYALHFTLSTNSLQSETFSEVDLKNVGTDMFAVSSSSNVIDCSSYCSLNEYDSTNKFSEASFVDEPFTTCKSSGFFINDLENDEDSQNLCINEVNTDLVASEEKNCHASSEHVDTYSNNNIGTSSPAKSRACQGLEGNTKVNEKASDHVICSSLSTHSSVTKQEYCDLNGSYFNEEDNLQTDFAFSQSKMDTVNSVAGWENRKKYPEDNSDYVSHSSCDEETSKYENSLNNFSSLDTIIKDSLTSIAIVCCVNEETNTVLEENDDAIFYSNTFSSSSVELLRKNEQDYEDCHFHSSGLNNVEMSNFDDDGTNTFINANCTDNSIERSNFSASISLADHCEAYDVSEKEDYDNGTQSNAKINDKKHLDTVVQSATILTSPSSLELLNDEQVFEESLEYNFDSSGKQLQVIKSVEQNNAILKSDESIYNFNENKTEENTELASQDAEDLDEWSDFTSVPTDDRPVKTSLNDTSKSIKVSSDDDLTSNNYLTAEKNDNTINLNATDDAEDDWAEFASATSVSNSGIIAAKNSNNLSSSIVENKIEPFGFDTAFTDIEFSNMNPSVADDDNWAEFTVASSTEITKSNLSIMGSSLAEIKDVVSTIVAQSMHHNEEQEEEIASTGLKQFLENSSESSNSENLQSAAFWQQLCAMEQTNTLHLQWSNSHTYQKLLGALNIDVQKVLTGLKKPAMPAYAAQLGLLQPVSGGGESKTKVADVASDANSPQCDDSQQDIPAVEFDWLSSGLSNPLDASSTMPLDLTFFANDDDISTSGFLVSEVVHREKELLKALEPSIPMSTPQPLESILANFKPTATSITNTNGKKTVEVSEEARRILGKLPNLSFMKARVLMFPVKQA